MIDVGEVTESCITVTIQEGRYEEVVCVRPVLSGRGQLIANAKEDSREAVTALQARVMQGVREVCANKVRGFDTASLDEIFRDAVVGKQLQFMLDEAKSEKGFELRAECNVCVCPTRLEILDGVALMYWSVLHHDVRVQAKNVALLDVAERVRDRLDDMIRAVRSDVKEADEGVKLESFLKRHKFACRGHAT